MSSPRAPWRLENFHHSPQWVKTDNSSSSHRFMIVSMLRQTLHLCWIGLVAVSLVWGSVTTASVTDCEESSCSCCAAHDLSSASFAPAEDCGCHWEMPAPPPLPHQEFAPFCPPILLITPAAPFRALPVWETQQTVRYSCPVSAAPALRRRHQCFCVYLI